MHDDGCEIFLLQLVNNAEIARNIILFLNIRAPHLLWLLYQVYEMKNDKRIAAFTIVLLDIAIIIQWNCFM